MNRGFSLIELTLVLLILVGIVSVTVPQYLLERARQRQKLCEDNLISLAHRQTDFLFKEGHYASTLGDLDWSVPAGPYQYDLQAAPGEFTITCRGNIDWDDTIDHVTIDESGLMEVVTDDLST